MGATNLGRDLLCKYRVHELILIIIYPEGLYLDRRVLSLYSLKNFTPLDSLPGLHDDLLLTVYQHEVFEYFGVEGHVALYDLGGTDSLRKRCRKNIRQLAALALVLFDMFTLF